MRVTSLVLASIATTAVAEELLCTFRSPTDPVHLVVTDNALHSKGIGTKVRTCDRNTCGDSEGDHKYVDCKDFLPINATTDVFVDNDLVYIQFFNNDTGTYENYYPATPPIQNRTIDLPLHNYGQDCTYRSPSDPVNITIHNTVQSPLGIKVRTCDEDECGDNERHYVDCPMHLPFGTSSILVDNDLHFLVFFDESAQTDQEYWPPAPPVGPGEISLPLPGNKGGNKKHVHVKL